ncbi:MULTISPECIES: WecB/TagA/CpsF family glycosyltransferase [Sphingobium]|jgi:N-acetylglucosaminyldiphosphoundecaprenol N-acetyl-beta-D-mannosaminyltransferase|uniref:WecB/TagA/CpsF family glycosyltransferase n=1 Tax=Sphingobium tyrosinilyticum TaxID=2715436 RepID=A0ABV9F2I3_9SPHN|nr:WecB/TagA/CpsF family glycosyltransferase [Sphingobium sp. EP60837]ANI76519.1 N-acetylglucosaminyldiphosphoundecaprenol N-acetyl-beta-D-mannosaminyltransferase [Sphingobium sp. EP60837]
MNTEQALRQPFPSSEGQEKSVMVGGVPVSTLSLDALINKMVRDAPLRRMQQEPALLVFDCNGQGLSMNASDAAFRADLAQADLIHADGQIIVLASRWFSTTPIADRSSTTDMFIDSLGRAAEHGVRYFLLGGEEKVNAECARRIIEATPGLELAGRRNGFWSREEEEALIAEINATSPDVLWVGTGKPREQAFCVRHRDRIKAGWIVTCGGLFNYVTGDYPRAPLWMQKAGLEWLHRMVTRPKQLAWRYITTNPHALWLIWKHRHG